MQNREEIKLQIEKSLFEIKNVQMTLSETMGLKEDLGLDSVDIFSLSAELEDQFDIILQDSLVGPPKNVGELIDFIMALQNQG